MNKLLLLFALLVAGQPVLDAKSPQLKRAENGARQKKKQAVKPSAKKKPAPKKQVQPKNKKELIERQKKVNQQKKAERLKKAEEHKKMLEIKAFALMRAQCQHECTKHRLSKPVVFEQSLRQMGPHCGYYAAYNSACKIAELTGKPKPAFNLPLWAKAIVARRKLLHIGKGPEGLFPDEVAYVATTLLGLKPNDFTFFSENTFKPHEYHFISPDWTVMPHEFEVRQIQQKISNDKPHAFICCLKWDKEWHAVCAIATKRAYHFMDSNNLPNMFIQAIKTLDKKLVAVAA